MFGKNSVYQIKTKNGFEDFYGIQRLEDRKTVCVIIENGTTLDCTPEHKLMTPFGFIEVSRLYEGDVVETTEGFKKIVKIYPNMGLEPVYDIINAGKDKQYYTNNILSHNCEFIGSTNTLIHPSKLKSLVWLDPLRKEENLDIHVEPEEGHTYCMTVDVAEGQNLDYSTFSVIDVTSIPYRQVAKYKNNKISPMLFPSIIVSTAKRYNNAFILVEINSIGLQVSDIIHFDLAYENLIKIQMKGKQGQQNTPGFTKKVAFGLKTNKQTKMIGCTNLKTLIESDKLIINDADTILELTTFSADKQTFKAEEGNHDDLAMTLVHFGWLTSQRYFKESINSDIRFALQKEILDIDDQMYMPPPIIDDGLKEDFFVEDDGSIWFNDREKRYPFDDLNFKPSWLK